MARASRFATPKVAEWNKTVADSSASLQSPKNAALMARVSVRLRRTTTSLVEASVP